MFVHPAAHPGTCWGQPDLFPPPLLGLHDPAGLTSIPTMLATPQMKQTSLPRPEPCGELGNTSGAVLQKDGLVFSCLP